MLLAISHIIRSKLRNQTVETDWAPHARTVLPMAHPALNRRTRVSACFDLQQRDALWVHRECIQLHCDVSFSDKGL